MSTPSWRNETGGGTDESASVNQLLGTHQTQEIFEGTAIVKVTANLGTTQPLLIGATHGGTTGVQYAQPFTMSGTEIDRIVLPLSVLNGIGSDVTVQLYNDNAGSPGTTASGAFVVPREFLVTNTGVFPDYFPPNATTWTQSLNLTYTVPITFPLAMQDGTFITIMAGEPPTNITINSSYSAPISSTSLAWTSAGTMPQGDPGGASAGTGTSLAFAGVATLNGLAVIAGGYANTTITPSGSALAASRDVFTTSNYTNGQPGGWQQQASLSVPLIAPSAAIVGPATTGPNIGNYQVYLLGNFAWQTQSNTTFTATTATDSNPTPPQWATNEFANCTVIALLASSVSSATIASNTATTLTISGSWSNGTPPNNSGFVIINQYVGYTAVMTPTGGITSWSPLTTPISFTAAASGSTQVLPALVGTESGFVVANGFLIVIGGAYFTPAFSSWYDQVFAAKINTDNTIGPWVKWPTLPTAVGDATVGVYNNTLWVVNGATNSGGVGQFVDSYNVQALPVGVNGPAAAWSTLSNLPASPSGLTATGWKLGVNSSGVAVGVGKNPAAANGPWNGGVTATLGNVPTVSVPLRVTGLSNSTKYHVVVAPVTTGYGGSNSFSDTTGIQVGTNVAGGGGFTALQKVGSGAWTTLATGSGIPMTIYQGTSGRPIHYLEDVANNVPARQTWLIFDPIPVAGGTGLLRAIGEHAGNNRQLRTLNYGSNGTLQSLGSLAGAGFMTAGYSPGGVSPGTFSGNANAGGLASGLPIPGGSVAGQ